MTLGHRSHKLYGLQYFFGIRQIRCLLLILWQSFMEFIQQQTILLCWILKGSNVGLQPDGWSLVSIRPWPRRRVRRLLGLKPDVSRKSGRSLLKSWTPLDGQSRTSLVWRTGRSQPMCWTPTDMFCIILLTSFRFSISTRNFFINSHMYMDCYWIVFYTTPRSMIMCDQFLLYTLCSCFCFSPWISLGTKLFSYLILFSDPYAAYYI